MGWHEEDGNEQFYRSSGNKMSQELKVQQGIVGKQAFLMNANDN